jgi:hypothetical protein
MRNKKATNGKFKPQSHFILWHHNCFNKRKFKKLFKQLNIKKMKTLFKTLGMLGLFFFLLGNVGWGQTTYYTDARCPTAVSANDITNWNSARDWSGSAPSNFISGDIFVITSGTILETMGDWAISGTNSKLQIENGGSLSTLFPLTLSTATTLQIDAGGTYKHQNDASYATTIFQGTENFSNTSNFEINASNIVGPGNVAFGNLIINLTIGPIDNINCDSRLTTINGYFEIINTYVDPIEYEFILSNNSSLTLNLGGDLIISGGVLNFSSGDFADNEYIFNISGNYNQSGGTFKHYNIAENSNLNVKFNGVGKSYINTVAIGSGEFNYINWIVDVGAGNSFTLSSAFNLPTSRTITINTGNLTVASGILLTINGIIDCKTNIVNGSTGKFTLASGGTIKTAHANGVGTTGSIQVTGAKTYNTAGKYEYNGTSAQTSGTAYSTSNTITINNAAGVTFSNNKIVNGSLTMTKGNLSLGGFTLTYGASSYLKYNGIETQADDAKTTPNLLHKKKIVTFLGRITIQKGPEYFVNVARMVIQRMKNVHFVMAGNGELRNKIIELSARYGISHRFHFTGFLNGSEVTEMLHRSDLFIMPSVSEPFGIVPLEAMQANVPVIISIQSGVSEVIRNVIKTDFWDVHAMADAVHGILKYKKLTETLIAEGKQEVGKLNWKLPAFQIKQVYLNALLNKVS